MIYPEPTNIWEHLEYSSLGIFIAESGWAFPTIETLHVIALVTVVGTIMVMDLRLLGFASRGRTVRQMTADTLPWTWAGFILALVTGLLLFTSKAGTYMMNPYFLLKMILLALAGLNMLLFHFLTYKSVDKWDDGTAVIPTGAKVAGILSLVFWFTIVFLGRAIGFTLGFFYPEMCADVATESWTCFW